MDGMIVGESEKYRIQKGADEGRAGRQSRKDFERGEKTEEGGDDIDLMKEFETDVFFRACAAVSDEASWERIPSFGQGRRAYQAAAGAELEIKRGRVTTSKKA